MHSFAEVPYIGRRHRLRNFPEVDLGSLYKILPTYLLRSKPSTTTS